MQACSSTTAAFGVAYGSGYGIQQACVEVDVQSGCTGLDAEISEQSTRTGGMGADSGSSSYDRSGSSWTTNRKVAQRVTRKGIQVDRELGFGGTYRLTKELGNVFQKFLDYE